jgi:DNA-directed RNA polymerase specialized sigma24 family protein
MPVLEQQSDLLQQFSRGDVDAFEALFRLHQGEVYRWILRIVRDPAAAEDLTVETFWRIHRAHARFDPARSFGAWARRIASNAALDYLRSTRQESELPEEQPYQEIADALGVSAGAVKLRVFRALRILRKTLKQQGVEP